MNTEIVPFKGADLYRASTDAATLCKAIVTATARNIQGRKYVQVEGWQAIATAHGCVASAGQVSRVEDEGSKGFMAIGRVIRMDNGQEIATAEGFVGDDERMWANRPVYARRAMAQTRAISRACRSAFAHVVVMMNAGLETTPAEEVPPEGFHDMGTAQRVETPPAAPTPSAGTIEPAVEQSFNNAIASALGPAELAEIDKDAMEVCKVAGDRNAAKRIRKAIKDRAAALVPEMQP